jgi:hypothetical protein
MMKRAGTKKMSLMTLMNLRIIKFCKTSASAIIAGV